MRQILFRGKRIDNGEWVYGDLVANKATGTYRIWHDFANVKHGDFTESGLHECSGSLFNVDPKSVGQYTGIKDKHDRKIFEGDLIRKESDILAVEYFDSCFRTPKNGSSYRLGGWRKDYIEVIGNIHEHPELLTPSLNRP